MNSERLIENIVWSSFLTSTAPLSSAKALPAEGNRLMGLLTTYKGHPYKRSDFLCRKQRRSVWFQRSTLNAVEQNRRKTNENCRIRFQPSRSSESMRNGQVDYTHDIWLRLHSHRRRSQILGIDACLLYILCLSLSLSLFTTHTRSHFLPSSQSQLTVSLISVDVRTHKRHNDRQWTVNWCLSISVCLFEQIKRDLCTCNAPTTRSPNIFFSQISIRAQTTANDRFKLFTNNLSKQIE